MPSTIELRSAFDPNGTVTIKAMADASPDASSSAEGGRKKLATFEMLAYTGGKLHMPDLPYPVVVVLAGMKHKQKHPIRYDHDEKILLGHSERVIAASSNVTATGVFSGKHEKVEEVIEMGLNEFPWQASIHAQVTEVSWLDDGESTVVNNREISGPCYIGNQSILREITIAANGVDDDTSLTVAASLGNQPMEAAMSTSQTTPGQAANNQPAPGTTAPAIDPANVSPANPVDVSASVQPGGSTIPVSSATGNQLPADIQRQNELIAANEERVAGIQRICASYDSPPMFTPDGATEPVLLSSHAIRANWTTDVVQAIASRNDRPQAPAGHVRSHEMPTELLIEAAICKTGRLESLERRFDEKTLSTVDQHRDLRNGVGLQQLLIMAAYIGGMPMRAGGLSNSDIPGVLKAAFSTNALNSILSNVASKFMMDGFASIESAWKKIASIGSPNNFLEYETYRLQDSGVFEKVPSTGIIPAGKVSDTGYGNRADEYAKYISIGRKAIKNDNIGIITQAPFQLSRGAHKGLNRVFWAEFQKNLAQFFTTQRGNYAAGADTDLGVDGLTRAVAMLKQIKDDGGKDPMDTMGRYLVCNANDETLANTLYQSQNLITGTGGTQGNANVHAGKYEPVASAYLTDPDAWYLLADPNDLPIIEVGFVDGQQEPIIEEAIPDATHSGIILRGFYDFGVRKQEYRGGVRMKGKA